MESAGDRVAWGRQAKRDALACLSLANLYCINLWLEAANSGFDYYRNARPTAAAIWSIAVLVVLLASGFWLAVQAWRRWAGPWARGIAVIGIAIALLIPFQIARRHVLATAMASLDDVLGSSVMRVGTFLVMIAFLVVLVARTEKVARHLVSALIMLLPLAPVLAVQSAFVQLRRPSQDVYSGNVQQAGRGAARTKLLVMVFDEWDQRVAFDHRPSRVALPVADRLREGGFVATRAIGGGYLGVTSSIASMLTGQRLRSIEPRSVGAATDHGRFFRTDPAASWADQPTIFSELRRLRLSTSIVGWYVPYCRVLADWVDDCSWEPGASIYARSELLWESPLLERVGILARRQLGLLPLADELALDSTENERRILLREELSRVEGEFAASFDAADVLYVHWPIPHPLGLPAGATPDLPGNYLDNLMAVDQLLGRIETRLTQEQRWEDVTLLLTSDHSLRPSYWDDTEAWTEEEEQATDGGKRFPYVPFIVKFGGRHDPVQFDQPFSIVLMHDVVLEIARGGIASPAELADWLTQNRHKHPSDIAE